MDTGYIHILATVHNAAMSIGVHVSFQISVLEFFFSDIYSEVEFLGHIVVPLSVFGETSIPFSTVAAPI